MANQLEILQREGKNTAKKSPPGVEQASKTGNTLPLQRGVTCTGSDHGATYAPGVDKNSKQQRLTAGCVITTTDQLEAYKEEIHEKLPRAQLNPQFLVDRETAHLKTTSSEMWYQKPAHCQETDLNELEIKRDIF